MTRKDIPSPEEVQKEFEDFVKNRFGGNVKVFTTNSSSLSEEEQKEIFGHPESVDKIPQEKEVFDLKFELKPKEVKSYLDRYVIKQDEAKKALAIAVCDHYNQVIAHHKNPEFRSRDYAKQNVLVLGPTGVGKTYMIRQIAKLIGVPFVKGDATRFSETGYMGANVDDLIRDLVHQANGNIELAQYGIVYLDEGDKLAMPKVNHGAKDVNGRGVQLGLLKLMEETEVDLRSGNDPASHMQAMMDFQKRGKVDKQIVNTKHILFIVSGAFHGLKDIIGKRLNKRAIGFNKEFEQKNEDALLHQVTTQDFIDYGFEPEFIGRLPVRVACDHLEAKDLAEILKNSEGSIVKQYQSAFNAYGIETFFTDDALLKIAELASQEKTGARALMTICEKTFRDYKYELPSTNIQELIINSDMIENPSLELEKLLNNPEKIRRQNSKKQIRNFAKSFYEQHQMQLKFSDKSIDLICDLAAKKEQSIQQFLGDLLQSYAYGLKLVQQNTGQDTFEIDVDIIQDPRGVLEKLIKDSYVQSHKI